MGRPRRVGCDMAAERNQTANRPLITAMFNDYVKMQPSNG